VAIRAQWRVLAGEKRPQQTHVIGRPDRRCARA
jgi:hypothetical protein